MASQDDGDEIFSDDDLDDLPPNALEELEKNAIRQTQHQTQATVIVEPHPSSDYGDEFDDDDLDDAVVIDETGGVPNRFPPLQPFNASLGTQGDHFQQGQYWGRNHLNSLAARPLETEWFYPKHPTRQQNVGQVQPTTDRLSTERQEALSTQADPNTVVDALQQQVQELLRERENLKKQVDLKSGEIAIVRSKHEKVTKEFQRELIAIRQLNTRKFAEQEKAIEEAISAERKKATELEFVKRDLLDEAEKVRYMRRAQEKAKPTTVEPVQTPKKNRSIAYRDGFDDDEIQVISPSKFQARKSNPSTPTKAGAKRKRKAPESPIPSLEIAQEERPVEAEAQLKATILDDASLEKLQKPDDRLDFLEAMFDHRPYRDHLRTIEEFTKISFPSAPTESFASIILGKLPTMGLKRPASNFPIEFCELITSFWSRCLEEGYYKPLYLIIDLLTFALELKTLTISPSITDSLLVVAQQTADLIAIPRFKQESTAHLEKDIDATACLTVIHLVALGCMNNKEHTTNFWRGIRIDFVLTILSQHQSPKDFEIMLQLLSMSTMKDSFGPKSTDRDLQQEQAIYIIDRISRMLIFSPTVPEGSSAYDPSVISNLRLQILHTLNTLSQTAWGGKAVAVHENTAGRLVKFMSDELELLYDYRSGHKQSAVLIGLSIRLLHHLVIKHDKDINMQAKLSRVPGGMRKYLICLSRLTFAEDDLVLDADVDPEVAECAKEMLELVVSPEEGDAIHSAFSST